MSDPQNSPPPQQPFDHPRFWANRAFDRTDNRYEMQIQAAVELTHVALKALLLLNGAAAIALLAFTANVLHAGPPTTAADEMLDKVGHALVLFACGAAAAVAASCLAYVVNRVYGVQGQKLEKSWDHPFVRLPRLRSGGGRLATG